MSGGTLGILYAADDGYAPFLGVSMLSLFESNRDVERIRVYAVLDNVNGENISKLREVADHYGRELVIVEAAALNRQLETLGIPMYRGNYATNYRLFFHSIIDDDVDCLIYLDCDTLVLGNVDSLARSLTGGIPAAVVMDSLSRKYKGILGFPPEVPYFNAGVLVIDTAEWKKQKVTESIFEHAGSVRSAYCNPDQDLLNIALRGKIKILGPEYNFQPVHRAYSDLAYQKVYGFENYYLPEQVESARKDPVILHTYRFLGQFPWHKDNLHPDTNIFDSYLVRSPWKDYQKQITKCCSLCFKIERFLYTILPKTWFLRLFAFMQERSFRLQDAEIRQGLSSGQVLLSPRAS